MQAKLATSVNQNCSGTSDALPSNLQLMMIIANDIEANNASNSLLILVSISTQQFVRCKFHPLT